ncbi:MAG: hypothetical protein KBD14_01475 [Candidatus Pacebacteria bacterium]|nr:hypothetical protein [Candidatus Paceibacterota bacterium]
MSYRSETKNCQNCKNDFTIESDDFSFYEKMKVPAPTWCPECRFQRRLSFMNIFSLYKSNCSKCKESIISMFHKGKDLIVYCPKCWWADDWDGTEYSIEYDPNRTFFEQWFELKQKTPHMALDTLYSSLVNTNYTNYSSYLKNSYSLFFADYAENSLYSQFLNTMKDTSDCLRIRESELCYDSVGLYKCFGCIGSLECNNSVNMIFSKNCSNCNDCFGCMNLKSKSYCIFNKQYSKEEYLEFMQNINLENYDNYQKYKEQSKIFWLTQPNRSFYGNSLNINVSGDYTYESKNTKNSYLVTSAEDSKFIQMISVPKTKDAYDYTCWGGNSEKIYETLIAGHGASNIRFSIAAYPDVLNIEYGYYNATCKNTFGSVNLKRKNYCILNKEYSKEDYEILRERIINDMNNNPYVDKRGRVYKYGEFFPVEFSSFGYKETFATQYFNLSDKDIEFFGFNDFEGSNNEYQHDMLSSELPNSLFDFENLFSKVIKCDCGKCYKIIEQEYQILKKLKLPIPRQCPDCRKGERFALVLPPKTFERSCSKCNSLILTAYDSSRPEIVYCEKCYQQEVY